MKLGISKKLILTISGLLVSTALIFGWNTTSYLISAQKKGLREKGVALAQQFANSSEYGIVFGNIELLKNLSQKLLEEPNIIFVRVVDADGTTLVMESEDTDLPLTPSSETSFFLDNNTGTVHEHTVKHNDQIHRFMVIRYRVLSEQQPAESPELDLFQEIQPPSEAEWIATVQIGLSLENLTDTIQQVRGKMFIMTTVILCFGIAGAMLLAYYLTQPLKQLVKGTEQIGSGRLDFTLHVKTHDEIAQLADSFNAMTERLRQTTVSRDYVDEILHSLYETLIVVNPDGTVGLANPSASHLLGYSLEELTGMSFSKIIELPEGTSNAFENLIGRGSTHNIEATYRSKSEQEIPMELSTAIMRDENQQPLGIVCVAQDITLRKQTERNMQLALDRERAASSAKDNFLANVSHEIRTPLNAIMGMTELAMETHNTQDQLSEYLQQTYSSSEILLTLINDLLDLSKIESGKFDIESASFNLRKFVDFRVNLFRSQAEKAGIEIGYTIFDKVPEYVEGDVHRLGQVLLNLIGNSIKFTRAGGAVWFFVDVKECAARKWKLTFAVIDSGAGIPPEKQKMIFEAFTQADTTLTRKHEGTGLGLAIASQLVSLMGGTLQVRSQPGIGTVFFFDLHMHRAEDSKQEQDISVVQPQPLPAKNSGDTLKNKHILVVEDNKVNSLLVVRQLEKKGAEVVVAENGQIAVDLFQADSSFDLIIMDCQMPVMDGFQATALIRDKNRRDGAHTPIIGFTAHAGETHRNKCLDAGMDGYLSKPAKGNELFAIIERFLS